MALYLVKDVHTGTEVILSGDSRLSEHFTVSEVACKDGSKVVYYSSKVLKWLEAIREACGTPIIINSFFRTPEHNKNVGGVSNSLHMKGLAVDFRIPIGQTGTSLEKIVFHVCGQVIGYHMYEDRNFCHIDDRGYIGRWDD